MAVFDPPTLSRLVTFPYIHPPSVTSFIVHEMGTGASMRTPQKRSFQILQQILYGRRNRIWQCRPKI